MVMNSEQAVPPPNSKAQFTIHPISSLGRVVTLFNGIYFSIIEQK